MKVSTTLHFNGQCEAAFKFYERLGAKIEFLLKLGESPAGDLYGVVVDRYSIPWEVNCEAR